jgi:hypothetical protein
MEGRPALWTLVSVFVVFKVATTIMIILAAPGSMGTTIGLFIAFHWPFALAAVIFGLAPALFWIRLVRVRAKRRRLQAEEWRVDPPVSPPISRT